MFMSKPQWNYLVDVLMFSLMGAMIFIGVLMGFFITSGPMVDEGSKYFWGLHRHQWGDIHAILSFGFVALFTIHLVLHWSWIKGSTRKLLRLPSSLVVVLLLPALVILAAWSFSEKDSPAYSGYGTRAGSTIGRVAETPASPPPPENVAAEEDTTEEKKGKKVEINGRMSLADIETATGLKAGEIAEKLGLPGDAPRDQKLGQLRRRYGFQLQQVRDLIMELSGGAIEAVDSDEVPAPAPQGRKQQEHQGSHLQEINGHLTLDDLERLTGISAGAILKKLKLPESTSRNERLGQLRRRHGISMQQIRDTVSSLAGK